MHLFVHTGTPLADGTVQELGGTALLPKAVPPTALEMTRMIATARVYIYICKYLLMSF
jgi:hypothetical protein